MVILVTIGLFLSLGVVVVMIAMARRIEELERENEALRTQLPSKRVDQNE